MFDDINVVLEAIEVPLDRHVAILLYEIESMFRFMQSLWLTLLALEVEHDVLDGLKKL
jgi:hypothetical protein